MGEVRFLPGGEVKRVQDLLDALRSVAMGRPEVWFRGHRDHAWRLEPSVFRKSSNVRDNEKAILADFKHEAASGGLPYGLDEWGWVTFAQHHNVPTRLLDWSKNPLIALYFAVQEKEDVATDGAFFILDPEALNKEAGGHDEKRPLLLDDREAQLRDYLPGSRLPMPTRAVIAPHSFDRIRFQAGAFTLSGYPQAGDEADLLRNSSAVDTLVIHSSSKGDIRHELSLLGFDNATIFRDLDHIGDRIRQSYERGHS